VLFAGFSAAAALSLTRAAPAEAVRGKTVS